MYFTNNQRNTPIPEFSGFTLAQMDRIVSEPFSDNCPVRVSAEIPEELLRQSPLYLIARDLLRRIEAEDGLPVTAKGNLQRKVVRDLYDRRYLPADDIEDGITKLSSEEDWRPLHCTKIVLKQAGIIRQYRNKLRLTKHGSSLLQASPGGRLFVEFLKGFALEFNWAYNDGYHQPVAGQLGSLYLLYLLRVHGEEWREVSFYTDRYYQVFPDIRIEQEENPDAISDESERVITTRFFNRFAGWFGLAEAEYEGKKFWGNMIRVKRTPLLAALVEADEHPPDADSAAAPIPGEKKAETGPVIREALQEFLAEQEKRLKPRTSRDYRLTIELFEDCLDGYAYMHLNDEDEERFEAAFAEGRQFCDIFGTAQILPDDFSEFLGYFMIRKVMGSRDEVTTTCRVMRKLVDWLNDRGVFAEYEYREAAEMVAYYKDVLPDASQAGDLISDYAFSRQTRDTGDYDDYTEGMFVINRIEPGTLWLQEEFGAEPGEIPLEVPREITDLCREGWWVNLELGKTPQGWEIVSSGNVYP